ncbi:MAG: class I SAM-dependent methyltransferase [Magnetococcales bacterium]|nr:class I SAM-dependent methyltransferase [Magnetococcales bacterium]
MNGSVGIKPTQNLPRLTVKPHMLLNDLEKRLMNSPLRWATQRLVDVRFFLEMGGPTPGARTLEMGCGNGRGMEMIHQQFKAHRVDGFDLDPEMVTLAQERILPRWPESTIRVGDATRIQADDDSYDAVFDFGIIHHVPAWRDVLWETRRVLKPGGKFYVFEMLAEFIQHPLWRVLLTHPQEDRFGFDDFQDALSVQGFSVLGARHVRHKMAWYVAERLP